MNYRRPGLATGKKYQCIKSESIEMEISPIQVGQSPGSKYYNNISVMKDKISKLKDSMEPYFQNHGDYFRSITSNFESFKKTRFHISERFNTPSVSNNWIIMYEIISKFDLIPKEFSDEWIHFNNENLPCDTILPVYHYVNTFCEDNSAKNYKWYSSYPTDERSYRGADIYKIVCRFKNNIMTDPLNEVFKNPESSSYADKICSEFNKKVDLYTGNITKNINKDYNREELLNSKLFLAQIYLSVKLLKTNGSAIFKIYGMSSKFNISVIAWLRGYFKNIYIYKPESSKSDSSELYIICKHYRIIRHDDLLIVKGILDNDGYDYENGMLVDITKISHHFWIEFHSVYEKIYLRQAASISNKMNNFMLLLNGQSLTKDDIGIYKRLQNKSRGIFKNKSDKDNIDWYGKFPILVLHKKKWLQVVNLTKLQCFPRKRS